MKIFVISITDKDNYTGEMKIQTPTKTAAYIRKGYHATWGYNPTATVTINNRERYTGKASGCGYDKESAAIAQALNQSETVLKFLYTINGGLLQDTATGELFAITARNSALMMVF